jgi:hypothetical protein
MEAIKEKGGFARGLDVYENEPGGGSAPFKETELAKLLSRNIRVLSV